MLRLEDSEVPGYERVVRMTDEDVGMRGFIAVHSVTRGPGLGGLRIREYPSADDALHDVLDLSEAMTYKAAAAGLPFGGGKAVIMGDPSEVKKPELLEQYGHAVESLDGTYITAEDVGTTVPDLAKVAEVTRWVAGLPTESGGSGDPSPATARGVMAAIGAVADRIWGHDRLDGRSVLVQGLGKVGAELVRLLDEAGAELVVADVDFDRVEETRARHPHARVVPANTCLGEDVDILSPCALGGVLSPYSVPELRCRAVVGSANNQLASPDAARAMRDRGIAYAPDFVANAGGIINIASEYGYTRAQVDETLDRIGDTTAEVLEVAESRDTTTHEAAMKIAKRRLESPQGS